MRMCPYCQSTNPEAAASCWKCGENLRRSWVSKITDAISGVLAPKTKKVEGPDMAGRVTAKPIGVIHDESHGAGKDTAGAIDGVSDEDLEKAMEDIPKLIGLLEDKEWDVRAEAAFILGRIGEKDPRAVRAAIPKLMNSLEDEDGDVRANAAFALGEIGGMEALEKLKGLLSDSTEAPFSWEENVTVGEIAQEAIERLEARLGSQQR